MYWLAILWHEGFGTLYVCPALVRLYELNGVCESRTILEISTVKSGPGRTDDADDLQLTLTSLQFNSNDPIRLRRVMVSFLVAYTSFETLFCVV